MKYYSILGLIASASISMSASAALVGYTDNPSTNSSDWAAAASGTINSNVNFNTMITGALDSNFYKLTDGVTITTGGDFNGVFSGAGPGNTNISSGPVSSGEGLHAASNHLQGGGGEWNMTVSFDEAISGLGLDTVDFFGASTRNERLTLEAFSGKDGTGVSLGVFDSFNQNYQKNNTYFMGLHSDSLNIMSIVFTDFNGLSGDVIGVDNVVFSRLSAVPVPAALFMFTPALVGFMALRRRAKKLTA